MKTIYLVRHCLASGQAIDAPLTEEGLEQAKELAAYFSGKSIDRIVSSSYTRAKQSVVPLSENLSLEIEEDERLSERVLTDSRIDNWQARLRESYEDIDLCLQGGESSRDAMNRGYAVIEEILESDSENIVVTSHGGLSTSLLKYFDDSYGYDTWEAMTNPDVYRLTFEDCRLQELIRVWQVAGTE